MICKCEEDEALYIETHALAIQRANSPTEAYAMMCKNTLTALEYPRAIIIRVGCVVARPASRIL